MGSFTSSHMLLYNSEYDTSLVINMNHAELKALQVQITKAEAEHAVAQEEQRNASISADRALKKLKALKQKLADHAQSSAVPIVSEHALLRYIERIHGIDIEEVRKRILTPTTIQAARVVKSGAFPLECGGRAVIKNNTIVSIVE